jgi:hypothetical protein
MTILIGIPLGFFLKNIKKNSQFVTLAVFGLLGGTVVNSVLYVSMIEWCYSLEAPPLNVSCMNFLPGIIGSFVFGLILAIVVTGIVYNH